MKPIMKQIMKKNTLIYVMMVILCVAAIITKTTLINGQCRMNSFFVFLMLMLIHLWLKAKYACHTTFNTSKYFCPLYWRWLMSAQSWLMLTDEW